MSKVSIITTTYKHEKFIAHTIDSVLSQSFIDWELLIGDDSPDGVSWAIIEEYTKKYPDKIRAWHHSPNKGIVENTNFLLGKICQDSQYIAFLEGDDMYTPDNLEKKLEVFETHKDVKLVYSDLAFIDSKNSTILPSFFHYRGIRLFQDEIIPVDQFILMPAGPIASWSTGMVRREIIEQYPIIARWEDKRYSIADYDFYFSVATRHRVYGIDLPLTQYRRHGGNLSGANGGTSFDLERYIELIYQEKRIPESIYKLKKSWLFITFAIFALEHNNKKYAWKYFCNSIRSRFFYKAHYKLAIFGFLLVPSFLSAKILRFLIKRGD